MSLTDEQRALATRLWAEGRSIKFIARKLGVKPKQVSDFAINNRDACPHRWRRVSDETAEAMASMRRRGMTAGEVAEAMGVTRNTVYRRTRGRV